MTPLNSVESNEEY